jgi:uncharacterized protein YndB with AHSA1/START domain/dihydrofolate reductase
VATAPSSRRASDREIVVSCTIDGPRRLVYEAFTSARHLSQWWGPNGFSTTTRAFEFRPGGVWDFIMHSPDGADLPNWIEWREIVPPERIVYLHGEGDDDPRAFVSTVTLVERGPVTEVTMRAVFATKEQCDAVIERYGALEGGTQHLGRLSAYVVTSSRRAGNQRKGENMSKVFFSVTMSLDGFIAPEFMEVGRPPDQWINEWMELQKYVFEQRFFRENLKLGDGGETGEDNRILEETFNRTGVSIMGKRMFDGGEMNWPEEAPFHTPVFVLTAEVRRPWERPGGTTFYFVNDGIESALRQAREVAGGKDIRIAGGAHTIVQYLNAGLVDEFSVAVSPVLFGAGVRLFEGVDKRAFSLAIVEAINSPMVTHLRYAVRRAAVEAARDDVAAVVTARP